MASFPAKEFLDTVAKATYLNIYRDKVVVDELDLKGSAPARVAFDQCWTWVRAQGAASERERHRWDHIPADPFSSDPGRAASVGGQAGRSRAKGSITGLFSSEDYPTSAAEKREEGTVGFRLSLGTDGRVSQCTILATSGFADLDAATCAILRRRARFSPATNATGEATSDTYDSTYTWKYDASSE